MLNFNFNLFKPKSKLGIDIGTASIKIVELGRKAGRFTLNNYGLFELKGDKDDKNSPILGRSILKLPDEEIVLGIKEILKKTGVKSKEATASISSFSTFSTVIEMPFLSDQDLIKVLPYETKKYIPTPLNEVVMDWNVIGMASEPNPDDKSKEKKSLQNVEIFLAAVHKSEAERYKRIISSSGLILVGLELENSSLARSLLGNDLRPTAIINIGGRSTSIVVIDKGYERISHNYEIGGFEITKSIAQSLNISLEKAEELKRKFGLKESEENIVNKAMVSLIDMMIFETKKTISNYEDSKNKKIERILLVGGLTNMPNFLNYFKNKLGREVYLGNALSRIIYPEPLNSINKEISSTFAISIGLAMRDN